MRHLTLVALLSGFAWVGQASAQQSLDTEAQCAAKYDAAMVAGKIGAISRDDFLKICVIVLFSSANGQQPANTTTAPSATLPTYTDPTTYCRAVGTVDYPTKDSRYMGPRRAEQIHAALHVDQPLRNAVTNQMLHFAWRCMDGKAWICIAYKEYLCGNAQIAAKKEEERVLTDSEVVNECQQNPNSQCVGGTHCTVGCKGTVPVMNRKGPRPRASQDARGFSPGIWRVVN